MDRALQYRSGKLSIWKHSEYEPLKSDKKFLYTNLEQFTYNLLEEKVKNIIKEDYKEDYIIKKDYIIKEDYKEDYIIKKDYIIKGDIINILTADMRAEQG